MNRGCKVESYSNKYFPNTPLTKTCQPLRLDAWGGALHGSLVPFHLPLLGFYFFVCVCVCVVL